MKQRLSILLLAVLALGALPASAQFIPGRAPCKMDGSDCGPTAIFPLLAPDGTAGAPAFSFASDPTLGIFKSGASQLSFAVGGNQVGTFYASQFSVFLPTLTLGGAADVMLYRRAAATLNLGAADAAAPVAQTLTMQGARGGTDTDTAAVATTIQGSLGTGTGATGDIVFKVGTPQAAGTAVHTVATPVMTLHDAGAAGVAKPQILAADGTAAAPSLSFAAQPNTGMFSGAGPFMSLVIGGTQALTINASGGATVYLPSRALTAGTMTESAIANVVKVLHRYDWTNAMIVALGGVGTGDISVATLPAKTVVTNVYVVILTPDTSANALTVACGRTAAAYIDYIVASDAKAVGGTVYGGAVGERGTNLTGYDLPSYAATTTINCQFVKDVTNLSTVLDSTGSVFVETMRLP